jgi:hypothetical protein
MVEKYILEVKYIDRINRCRKTSIVGVYLNEETLEAAKEKVLKIKTKYTPTFSVNMVYDLFTPYAVSD